LVYADDPILWTNNKELEENLYRLNNIGNKFGLKINFEKIMIQ
jgi:Reverse transcriptase (RNA-dependent DNA polymerase).